MEHFYQNIGEDWFDYPRLYTEMVNKFNNDSHFVEVGSWKGRSSVYMAVEIINSGKNIKFDCVDVWDYIDTQNDIKPEQFINLYDEFINNIEPVNEIINPIKKESILASKHYDNESLDFIFIDAAHDYENVLNDIKHWLPKLKVGGVIAGHDYFSAFGVKRAADEIFGNHLKTFDSCWYFEKTNSIKIVDCFLFYNELKMLKLRLEELYETVDYFVIVESTKTFIGNEKKLWFNENKNLFKKYEDKIIHVIDNGETYENPWDNEKRQRNSIVSGLKKLNLTVNDLVIISDVDEIPDKNTIYNLKITNINNILSLEQDLYYYNLSCKSSTKWYHPKILKYSLLKLYTPEEIRRSSTNVLPKGGWHLSYFGDTEFIKNKLKNFSHQEYNTVEFTTDEHIEYCIKNNLDLFKRENDGISYTYIDILNNDYLPENFKLLYGTLE